MLLKYLGLRDLDGIFYLCRCDCGAMTERKLRPMEDGRTVSCGCYWRERVKETSSTQHGLCRHPCYTHWKHLHYTNRVETDPAYGKEKARAEFYCQRWSSLPAFIEDMGIPKKNMALICVDLSQGYFKDNCEWIPSHKAAFRTYQVSMATGFVKAQRKWMAWGEYANPG